MKLAKMRAFWTPSVSQDVVSQRLVVVNENNSETVVDTIVSAQASEFLFEAPEKTLLTLVLTCTDGTYESDPVSTTFEVQDLQGPLSPTALSAEVVEIIDVKPSGN